MLGQAPATLALAALAAVLALVAAAELAAALPALARALRRGAARPPPPYPLRFLAVGDWGRRGADNQSLVADAMAGWARARGGVDFVVSTGDNFYESGLVSATDPAFEASFMNVYHHDELQVPWLAVLGNHDYGEFWRAGEHPACAPAAGPCSFSPLHVLGPGPPARDPRWRCARAFSQSFAGGDVELFFFDSNPHISEYRPAPWYRNAGGLAEQDPAGGIIELGARLARSRARWRFIVSHHPPRTATTRAGGYPEIAAALEPLAAAHGVHAVFSGHDHNLQALEVEVEVEAAAGASAAAHRYLQVISGGGSQAQGEFRAPGGPSRLRHHGSGFVAVEVRADAARVEFIGVEGELILVAEVPRAPLP